MAILCLLAVGSVSANDNVDLASPVQNMAATDIAVEDISSDSVENYNEGDGEYIDAPDYVDVSLKDCKVNLTMDVKKDSESINPLANETTVYLNMGGTEKEIKDCYKDGVILFNDSELVKYNSALLKILFNRTTDTGSINLVKNVDLILDDTGCYNITTNSSVNVNIHNGSVAFDVNVLKFGKNVTITKDDFTLVLTYIESKHDNETNVTENITHTIDITDFVLSEIAREVNNTNVTYNVISFNVSENEWGRLISKKEFIPANLSVKYKAGTDNEANSTVALKPVIDAVITVLTNQSATQYQNDYILVKLTDSVTGEALENTTLYFQLLNATFGINWGFNTTNKGIVNVSLDYMYGLGQSFIPVGKYYTLLVTSKGDIIAKGQNVTFNITKAPAKIVSGNYSSTYGSGKKFTVQVVNSKTNKGIMTVLNLRFYFSSKSYTDVLVGTNSTGHALIGINLGAGKYKVRITAKDGNVTLGTTYRYVTVKAVKAKISASKTSVYYNSNGYFKVKMVKAGTTTPLKGATVLLNVYTGKKYKVVRIVTDDKGIAKWNVSGIKLGKHITYVGSGSNGTSSCNVIKTTINVKKAVTTVSAPTVTNKYKTNSYFKAKVTNKATKKVINGLKIKVKVYTGKSYKTYTLTTDKKGLVQLNTKALSKGTHKVLISSANSNYSVSKTAYIKIN
ncbi:MAG: hypothetical protein MJ232_05485 [archaeon]|nr:hypothetical protein [archaeon]